MCHICRFLQKEINKYKFIELSRCYKFHDNAYETNSIRNKKQHFIWINLSFE